MRGTLWVPCQSERSSDASSCSPLTPRSRIWIFSTVFSASSSAPPRQASSRKPVMHPPSPNQVLPRRLGHRFRRYVPTPHSAFHGGRPAAASPIPSQIQVGNGTLCSRPQILRLRRRRKRGALLFHHVGLHQVGIAH